ncbi:hypothetical protein KDA00_01275 [Candidatus Saccharibacteria bacterium]|nr:hypothetical protein [Candidatus Saccharibacteria bacterium]
MNYFENVESIAVPKGENRAAAEAWMIDNGLELPEMPARCLHLAGG